VTAVLIAGALIASQFLAAQQPTNLQVDQTTSPTTVIDNRPTFRAQNNLPGGAANRFQIEVTTPGDPGFLAPLWSSTAPNTGTNFPGNLTVPFGTNTNSDVPYGQGTANLSTLPWFHWNTSYLWHVQFGRNNTWSGFSANASFSMAAPTITINQQTNNGDPNVDSWRFIGVPIAFGTTVPATELLSDVPLLYRLDEPSRTWIQMTSSDVLKGGVGYLAWCSPTTVLNLSQGSVLAGLPPVTNGSGSTTTPSYMITDTTPNSPISFTTLGAATGQEITDGVGVNGYRGNCLFANPFGSPLSWTSSTTPPGPTFGQVARLNISYAMYKWDGAQYVTYNGATGVGTAGEMIDPFQAVGIWIQATGYQLWINTPPPANGGIQKATAHTASAPTPPTLNPDSWHLMMEARSGAALDTENAFGIDPAASDDWDVRDSEEPGPGTATWVNVYFDHRNDFATYPRKYTHDFRKTPMNAGSQVSWTFTVDGNTNLPATLTFPNLSDINPGDWKFTLEDPAQSTTVVIVPSTSYDTLPVNGPSTLTLHATRLTDSPSNAPGSTSKSGGSSCGLLGPEGLLLAAWILARRAGRMRLTA
jgi:hypothetical protein